MKKIMMLMIVAVLMLGASQQAMAAFADGDLVRVVFSTNGTNEIATDLGSIANLTSSSSNQMTWNANNFNLSQLGGTASLADTYVVYFAITQSPNPKNQVWVSGPATGQSTVTKSAFSGFNTNSHTVTGEYTVLGGGASQVVEAVSDPNSFFTVMTAGGANVGNLGGFTPGNTAAISLANLASGYVDSVLYYYGTFGGAGASPATSIGTLRTYADGSTALNPAASPTPIPAAVYLFGSGLLGLAGLRRKMAA